MKSVPSTAKRVFDLALALPGLLIASPVIGISILAARRSSSATGLYRQERIGRNGDPFTVLKIRTMRQTTDSGTVTTASDARITPLGTKLRRTKLDELPQLFNVIRGDMSLVGPRPDVPGFADELRGSDRAVLNLRPGVTGPASLYFHDEESLLETVDDPQAYNSSVLWPLKVMINLAYVEKATLLDDIRLLLMTARPNVDSIERIISKWDDTVLTSEAAHQIVTIRQASGQSQEEATTGAQQ